MSKTKRENSDEPATVLGNPYYDVNFFTDVSKTGV